MTDEVKAVQVAEIQIQMGDESIIFAPTDDMTPKECALVMQMFLNAVAYRGEGLMDYGAFIAKHNLQKHFTALKVES